MNLDTLKAHRDKERQKDRHVHLEDDFYEQIADHLDDLEQRADTEDNQEEESRLRDRREQCLSVAEAITDRRQGKLIKQASLASSGMPAETDGMTPSEITLYEDIVDRLEDHRDEVLP